MGAPGNTHGSTYFQSTDLWNITGVGLVIPDQFQFISKLELPLLILGDGAFPLAKSIKKPYGDAVLSEEKCNFNYKGSKARMVIEGAFG